MMSPKTTTEAADFDGEQAVDTLKEGDSQNGSRC